METKNVYIVFTCFLCLQRDIRVARGTVIQRDGFKIGDFVAEKLRGGGVLSCRTTLICTTRSWQAILSHTKLAPRAKQRALICTTRS